MKTGRWIWQSQFADFFYSKQGMPATIMAELGEDEVDEENRPMYRIRFDDNIEFDAFNEELVEKIS